MVSVGSGQSWPAAHRVTASRNLAREGAAPTGAPGGRGLYTRLVPSIGAAPVPTVLRAQRSPATVTVPWGFRNFLRQHSSGFERRPSKAGTPAPPTKPLRKALPSSRLEQVPTHAHSTQAHIHAHACMCTHAHTSHTHTQRTCTHILTHVHKHTHNVHARSHLPAHTCQVHDAHTGASTHPCPRCRLTLPC